MKPMDVSHHGTALTRVKILSQQTYAVSGTSFNVNGITSVRRPLPEMIEKYMVRTPKTWNK